MFLHREHDASGPFVISQASHAWLAWQLACHWGNRRFKRPAPVAEVLAAVLLHDSGWATFDGAPSVDDDGRPRTFDRMPVETHLDIWRKSVARTAQNSRYAALLVAAHFRELAEHKSADLLARDLTFEARSVTRFEAEMQRLEASWGEQLAIDPRYDHALLGTGWKVNAQLLRGCDRLSVVLCASLGDSTVLPVVGADDSCVDVRMTTIGDHLFRLDPWPLEGRKLAVHCEGKRLMANTFTHTKAFRTALASAPVERFTFTFQRASA